MSSVWDNWSLADKNTGSNILAFKTFISAEIKQEGSVVYEPIEKSSFATYNKTSAPLEVNVVLGFEGTASDIQTTLDKLNELATTTTVFSLVTPAKEFENLTLEKYDFKWSEGGGVNMLVVNLPLREVKEVETSYSSVTIIGGRSNSLSSADTANSSNASSVDTGMTSTEDAGGKKTSLLYEVAGRVF